MSEERERVAGCWPDCLSEWFATLPPEIYAAIGVERRADLLTRVNAHCDRDYILKAAAPPQAAMPTRALDWLEIERVFRAAASRYSPTISGDCSMAMAMALKDYFERALFPNPTRQEPKP